ncbi:hypothetical protein WDU94_002334, partial [Cyamophila willieti]
RSFGRFLGPAGRPIFTKSFVLRPLHTSNLHFKFQVSSSYRSRDILITDRPTHEPLAQTNFFGVLRL